MIKRRDLCRNLETVASSDPFNSACHTSLCLPSVFRNFQYFLYLARVIRKSCSVILFSFVLLHYSNKLFEKSICRCIQNLDFFGWTVKTLLSLYGFKFTGRIKHEIRGLFILRPSAKITIGWEPTTIILGRLCVFLSSSSSDHDLNASSRVYSFAAANKLIPPFMLKLPLP